ncbi:MAG: MoxR family ATPase, partial [Rhodospirillales bacterium]
WAHALTQLDCLSLDPEMVNDTLGTLLKYQDDIQKIEGSEATRLLNEVKSQIAAAGAAGAN